MATKTAGRSRGTTGDDPPRPVNASSQKARGPSSSTIPSSGTVPTQPQPQHRPGVVPTYGINPSSKVWKEMFTSSGINPDEISRAPREPWQNPVVRSVASAASHTSASTQEVPTSTSRSTPRSITRPRSPSAGYLPATSEQYAALDQARAGHRQRSPSVGSASILNVVSPRTSTSSKAGKREISSTKDLATIVAPREDAPVLTSKKLKTSQSPRITFTKALPPMPLQETIPSNAPVPSSLAALVQSEPRRRVKSSANMEKIARWNQETLVATKHLRAAVSTSRSPMMSTCYSMEDRRSSQSFDSIATNTTFGTAQEDIDEESDVPVIIVVAPRPITTEGVIIDITEDGPRLVVDTTQARPCSQLRPRGSIRRPRPRPMSPGMIDHWSAQAEILIPPSPMLLSTVPLPDAQSTTSVNEGDQGNEELGDVSTNTITPGPQASACSAARLRANSDSSNTSGRSLPPSEHSVDSHGAGSTGSITSAGSNGTPKSSMSALKTVKEQMVGHARKPSVQEQSARHTRKPSISIRPAVTTRDGTAPWVGSQRLVRGQATELLSFLIEPSRRSSHQDGALRAFFWSAARHCITAQELFAYIRRKYENAKGTPEGLILLHDLRDGWMPNWVAETDGAVEIELRAWIVKVCVAYPEDGASLLQAFDGRSPNPFTNIIPTTIVLPEMTPFVVPGRKDRKFFQEAYLFDFDTPAGMQEMVRQLAFVFNKLFLALPAPTVLVLQWCLKGEPSVAEEKYRQAVRCLSSWVTRSITHAPAPTDVMPRVIFWMKLQQLCFESMNHAAAAAIHQGLRQEDARAKWEAMESKLLELQLFKVRRVPLAYYQSHIDQAQYWSPDPANPDDRLNYLYLLTPESRVDELPFVPSLDTYNAMVLRHGDERRILDRTTHNGHPVLRWDVLQENAVVAAQLEWARRRYPYRQNHITEFFQDHLADHQDKLFPDCRADRDILPETSTTEPKNAALARDLWAPRLVEERGRDRPSHRPTAADFRKIDCVMP